MRETESACVSQRVHGKYSKPPHRSLGRIQALQARQAAPPDRAGDMTIHVIIRMSK